MHVARRTLVIGGVRYEAGRPIPDGANIENMSELIQLGWVEVRSPRSAAAGVSVTRVSTDAKARFGAAIASKSGAKRKADSPAENASGLPETAAAEPESPAQPTTAKARRARKPAAKKASASRKPAARKAAAKKPAAKKASASRKPAARKASAIRKNTTKKTAEKKSNTTKKASPKKAPATDDPTPEKDG